MSQVIESVDVNVPISTAYQQWTQFESFPQFMDGVESVSRIDHDRTHWVITIGSVRREFDAEITEQLVDERIAWKSIGGDTSHAGVVTFQRIDDHVTRVTVQLTWQPSGLAEQAGHLLGMDGHQVRDDTARFKTFVERLRDEAEEPQTGDKTGALLGDESGAGQA